LTRTLSAKPGRRPLQLENRSSRPLLAGDRAERRDADPQRMWLAWPAVPEDNTRWHPTGLRIFTNRDPEEITRILELEPSAIRKARGGGQSEWVWLWKTGVDDTRPFADHAAAFIAACGPRAEKLREMSREGAVELRTGYAAALGQGGITLEPDLIALLSAMGAGVNLDLYPPEGDVDLNADQEVTG
jgi:hypothetical protein